MESSPLYEKLKAKNITESSLKLYLNNLRRLNGGEFPKNLTFLKNVEKILGDLEKYKPNTRRSYLITIVTSLKGEPKLKKIYDNYYKHLEVYNKEGATNNEKSETQKENWISQDEVKEIYDKLSEEVSAFKDNKKVSPSEYEKLLRWVTLSLYTTQKPRRNLDYLNAKIVNKFNADLDKEYNYFELPTGKWFFNNYKTKGTYKTQEIQASPEMIAVINTYLKFHPSGKTLKKKTGSVSFLVDSEGNSFQQKNFITRLLNKIFGKKIGVSMLRNIYLTDKYSGQMKEMKEDATEMGTSSSTIQNQYVKIDPTNATTPTEK